MWVLLISMALNGKPALEKVEGFSSYSACTSVVSEIKRDLGSSLIKGYFSCVEVR